MYSSVAPRSTPHCQLKPLRCREAGSPLSWNRQHGRFRYELERTTKYKYCAGNRSACCMKVHLNPYLAANWFILRWFVINQLRGLWILLMRSSEISRVPDTVQCYFVSFSSSWFAFLESIEDLVVSARAGLDLNLPQILDDWLWCIFAVFLIQCGMIGTFS